MMTRAARDKRFSTANDSGTGPATSASHALTAHTIEEHERYRVFASARFDASALEVTRFSLPAIDFGPIDDPDRSEADIVNIFRRKLAGLRFMSRRERAQAVRAALEWLWFAMAALRERRTFSRPTRVRRRGDRSGPSAA
jgi:hypothetical protein